jgi:lipopolysaccharide/colanic/teichoic acid biosynthesis glycosyltransferase
MIDILFSVIGLPFFALIFVILAPIIYFTDGGPIFYNGERIGKDGKVFRMFKFRSMYVNAPDLRLKDGSTYNGDDDPRVTKIGRLMRKTSLDEVPQLLNVFLGSMSIIGPRPNLPTVPFDELSELEKKRLTVKPGITGYNQAYFRNSVGILEKYKNDVYYVDNLSFAMDIKVFFRTIVSVLKRENINNS